MSIAIAECPRACSSGIKVSQHQAPCQAPCTSPKVATAQLWRWSDWMLPRAVDLARGERPPGGVERGSRLALRLDLRFVVYDLSVVPFRVCGQKLPHLMEALVLIRRVRELLVRALALEDGRDKVSVRVGVGLENVGGDVALTARLRSLHHLHDLVFGTRLQLHLGYGSVHGNLLAHR